MQILSRPHGLAKGRPQRQQRVLGPPVLVLGPSLDQPAGRQERDSVMPVRTQRGSEGKPRLVQSDRLFGASDVAQADRDIEVLVRLEAELALQLLRPLEGLERLGKTFLEDQRDRQVGPRGRAVRMHVDCMAGEHFSTGARHSVELAVDQTREAMRIVRGQGQGALEALDGFGHLLLALQHRAQAVMRLPVVRVRRDRLAHVAFGLLRKPRPQAAPRRSQVQLRGVEAGPLGLQESRPRLAGPAPGEQGRRPCEDQFGIVRRRPERRFDHRERITESSIVEQCVRFGDDACLPSGLRCAGGSRFSGVRCAGRRIRRWRDDRSEQLSQHFHRMVPAPVIAASMLAIASPRRGHRSLDIASATKRIRAGGCGSTGPDRSPRLLSGMPTARTWRHRRRRNPSRS